MSQAKLRKYKKEYREAVLAGRTDLADLEAKLKVEAGEVDFPNIVAEVAREKAEMDARMPPVAVQGETPSAGPAEENEATASVVADLPTGVAETRGLHVAGETEAPAVRDGENATLSVPDAMYRKCPNDISKLPKSDVWEVCVDESYLGKDTPGVRAGDFYGKEGSGLIAGVVFSPANPLPPIQQLHCCTKNPRDAPKTEAELRQEEAALDTILKHPACGVLALPARAQEMTLGYTDLLISWTCVMITLLPLPDGDGEVTVRCHVEPRPELQFPSDFEVYRRSCERQLRDAFPALARRIRLECDALPKVRDGNEKTLNSYPDIVAHTCQHLGPVAQQRFARTKWSGVCYLDSEPAQVERMIQTLLQGKRLEESAWTVFLKCEEVGLVRALVAHVGERARNDCAEWQYYLGRVADHLWSGAIDMRLLRLQVKWLETYLPRDPLPKKAELLWLTAQLALANHEGKVVRAMSDAIRKRFDSVCEQLYDDDAGLVCRAVLNLAVAYTNAYEFEMALAVLQVPLGKERALVGLENYGQLLSSAGQHFAFMGDTESAIGQFKAAIACFDGLSDPSARNLNIGITSAYLATAVMDGRPTEAISALAYYLLGDAKASMDRLVAETERLAQVSAESFADKFKHHIVLRYLVSAEREDPLRKAYRACGHDGKWSVPGEGHPWELIEFYRALLTVPDTPERRRHFERAYQIAVREGGDTVMVIAAVIAGAALRDGGNIELWNSRLAEACRQISHLRALWDNGRFQLLASQTEEGLSALDLAQKVLPFNFR